MEVKLVPALEGDETFVLARSVDRRAKELAMHEKFTARVEAGLQKMRAAAEAGRLKEEAVAGERLGRLKQRNWRASHAFDVTIKKLPEPKGKQHLEITWQRNAKFGDWSQLVDGCYLLRSNLKGVDAATLLEEIAKLKSGDVTLTARSSKNAPERTITLRVVTEPDSAQAVLLQRLGLTLPRRLRRIDHPVQM